MMLRTTTNKPTQSKKSVTIPNDKGKGRAVIGLLIIFAVLIAALAYSMRICWKKFYIENPELNVQEIIVTETQNYSGPKVAGKISVYTILSELGVETDLSNNIIDLDIRQIRERLEKEPILKNVEVRKIMPHTLSISFEERTPQAIVLCGRNSCYVDQDCVVLPLRHNDDTQLKYDTTGLPIITAVQNPDALTPGQQVTDKYIIASLDLLRKIQTHPGNKYLKIKQIQISSQDDLLITTVNPLPASNVFAPNATVIFPIFGMNDAVARLFHIASKYDKPSPILKLDVSYKVNIPLKTLANQQ
ncbi:MAG: FtsQ-type POTRA domain-containing protein [Victivallales bacterium]|nr:FtsQ-type POTRA domain-containing protein [Victivallales bacterium]